MTSPFLVWELSDADGHVVSCLLVPGRKPIVALHKDGTTAAVEEFVDLERAKRRTEELRDGLIRTSVAWCPLRGF